MGKKALYESIQALEAKVSEQGNIIYGLTCGNPTSYEFNPAIINQTNYVKIKARKWKNPLPLTGILT